MEQHILQWQTHEYPHKERTTDWYWAVGIIALSIVVTSIILKDFLFGIVIIIGTITLFIFALRHPKEITCELNEKGVLIDKQFYPYNTLESFCIDEMHPHNKKLVLKSKKMAMSYIIVSLEDTDERAVKAYLDYHIPEADHPEPLSHKLFDYFGF